MPTPRKQGTHAGETPRISPPMKILPALASLLFVLHASAQDGGTLPQPLPNLGNIYYRDPSVVTAVVELADKVPMLQVNLNNYKYAGNPILRGTPGEWDEAGVGRAVVQHMEGQDWRMWYDGFCKGGALKVGYATSKDGIHWTKYEGNPVFEASEEWEGNTTSATSVVYANGLFYLYYWAPGHLKPPKMKRIGLAVSKDGIHWEKKGIVLDADPQILNEGTASGGTGLDAAKVVYMRQEGRWYMIFTAFGACGNWNGLAQSPDGIHWTKVKGPVIQVRGPHNSLSDGMERWGTLRCPIQIGSIWAGFATGIGGGWAPAAALTLDEWVALGASSMPSKQDYESGMIGVPYSIEVADGYYYIYYKVGGTAASIGLIRAPMHSVHQPMLLWEKERITKRQTSMILEPNSVESVAGLTLNLTSDQPGEAAVLVWNPADQSWMEQESVPVQPNHLCSLTPPPHTKVRLAFTPKETPAVVSAWGVQ